MNRKEVFIFFTLLFTFALSACGGSSGGDGANPVPTGVVEITVSSNIPKN